MTCAHVSDAESHVQSHGDAPAFFPAWPLTSEVEFGPAKTANPTPSPSETPRKVWLCEIIPTLPPRSHQRLMLEGELRAMIRAIFSRGPYSDVQTLTELEQVRYGLLQSGGYTPSRAKGIEVRRREIKQSRGVRI